MLQRADHLDAVGDVRASTRIRGGRTGIADNVRKDWSASSSESGTPSRCINGLSGSHITPPDIPVDPPTYSLFSITNTSRPATVAATAPASPPPLPTTKKSVMWSQSAIAATSLSVGKGPSR